MLAFLLIFGSGLLAINGQDGWGWFLVVGIIIAILER